MLDQKWYDKIANSAAEAEAVLADAANEENAADEEQGAIEKIQEDIEIAQEVAATDLPTDVKVEIMADQGVDPEIISEVIDADTTDAVAAYYGVDPYWLHDKRAAAAKAVSKVTKAVAKKANKGSFTKALDQLTTRQKAALGAGVGGLGLGAFGTGVALGSPDVIVPKQAAANSPWLADKIAEGAPLQQVSRADWVKSLGTRGANRMLGRGAFKPTAGEYLTNPGMIYDAAAPWVKANPWKAGGIAGAGVAGATALGLGINYLRNQRKAAAAEAIANAQAAGY